MPTIPKPADPIVPEGYSAEQESVFDPLYETLLKRGMRVAGMDDPNAPIYGIASPLIAGVKPSEIGALRQKGKDLLDKVLKDGLEHRSMGRRPIKMSEIDRWRNLRNAGEPIPEDVYVPNVPVPDALAKALIFAQQKYPRIFGHAADLGGVDALHNIKAGGQILGSMFPEHELDLDIVSDNISDKLVPQKFGRLGFNSRLMETVDKDPASTVGHELLHLADNIVDPKWNKVGYEKSMKLPGGYSGSAFEARANVQGERFSNKMKGIPNPKPKSLDAIEDEILAQPQHSPMDMLPDDPIDWLMKKIGWK